MGESELPDIYLQEDEPEAKPVEEEYIGRGARVKTQVRYDDGLTEEQWLAAVDDSDDSIGDAVKRKQARIDKRKVNKARRDGDGESSPAVMSRESTEEPAPQPKKRGRKPGPAKRKAEELEEDPTPVAKRKRGGRPKADVLSAPERAMLQKSLKLIVNIIKGMEVEESDEGSPDPEDEDEGPLTRAIIGPFMELPPKKQYPDYYQFITNPIAIEQIEDRMSGHKYTSLDELQRDIDLLATNAKTYNEDGSMLYNDAVMIEKKCAEMIAQQQSEHPGLTILGEGDTNSTPAGSGMSTPRPSVPPGGTKLKLNFSAMANGHGSAD